MRVLNCVIEDHNLLLVGLAAVVCAVGSAISMNLYKKVLSSRGMTKATWLFTGAAAAGATIWCTHFIAMLAWAPGMAVSYEPFWTVISLAVALVGCSLAIWVGSRSDGKTSLLGGAVFGATVSAMHYTGMAGLDAFAFLYFDKAYVIASLVLASILGAASFGVMRLGRQRLRMVYAIVLMILAIVSLHFTGMTAVVVVPFDGMMAVGAVNDSMLAFGVAGVGLMLLGSALASYTLQEQAQRRESKRLKNMIEGAVDGMVVESAGEIIMVNNAFVAMIGLDEVHVLASTVGQWIDDADSMTDTVVVQSQLRQPGGEVFPIEVTVRHEVGENQEQVRLFAVRDLRRRLEQERRIAFLARNDSMTGLPNRASFLEKLQRMAELHKEGAGFALLAIDLDRFKDINDLYGHGVGDQLLIHIGNRLREAIVPGEFIARLGGDEFVALVPLGDTDDVEADRQEARQAAERLRRAIIVPMQGEHTDLGCGASVGVALWPQDASEPSILINNADLAMYRAKASLTESVCFYEKAMDEAVRHRRRVTQGLRDALDQGQFQIYYQPQVSVIDGEITGYEALLRWPQPDGSFVSPAEFIPVAEDTGLILPIGEWVLRKACEEAVLWPQPLRLAVNLSPVQLGHTDLPRLVHQILLDTGMAPSRLELEITETAMISDMARSTHILRQLKALGVSIAMDDFGTGYSSLSTLRAFPFDKIKLDRAFMNELEGSPQSRAIIRAVLTIGESLNIPVLAEGVETRDQLLFLRDQGCDEVQGFLLGRPAREALSVSHLGEDLAVAV